MPCAGKSFFTRFFRHTASYPFEAQACKSSTALVMLATSFSIEASRVSAWPVRSCSARTKRV